MYPYIDMFTLKNSRFQRMGERKIRISHLSGAFDATREATVGVAHTGRHLIERNLPVCSLGNKPLMANARCDTQP